jgi:hypothetical protein
VKEHEHKSHEKLWPLSFDPKIEEMPIEEMYERNKRIAKQFFKN